ncbi:MAG: serine/threonine protein kinase [Pirellulaceae bacterium]|nr:serine/threonine protein kinase [Pirellulaceae bacterium]
MLDLSPEKFLQRALDRKLITERQIESLWSDIGTRDVSLKEVCKHILRSELMTNYQIERLSKGERYGFFYGNYKVLYYVGAGTFARVYRAVHTETGRIVAAKVLRKRFLDDNDTKQQFLREGEIGMNLRHPNIVPVFEISDDRRTTYMIMEFVEGQNLRDFVKVQGSLSPLQSLMYTTDIVGGLTYAATLGIHHRDLKLSNIIVSKQGQAKLVDFGMAVVTGKKTAQAIRDCPNLRTVDYAGLEKLTNAPKNDPRSDVFFAGTLLYHLLTGRSPLHETKDRMQRMNLSRFREIVPLTKKIPDLPVPILRVVQKAMQIDLKHRYQSMNDLFSDLKKARLQIESGQIDTEDTQEEFLEGEGSTLIVIESNTMLQNALRNRLRKLGYRVLIMSDPQRALGRFLDKPTVADCAIFGAGELGAEAVEAFNKFRQQASLQSVPAILLFDEKQKGFLSKGMFSEKHLPILMPLKFRELRKSLQNVLQKKKVAQPPAGEPSS